MKITKSRLKEIIKEEVQRFQLKEYEGGPPPSYWEPDLGEEDERPTADVDEVVKYFISEVIGKTPTSDFMEKIAEKIYDDNKSWGSEYHKDFINDPRVQQAMQKDPMVQEEFEDGGTVEELMSFKDLEHHYDLADERERDYHRSQIFDRH